MTRKPLRLPSAEQIKGYRRRQRAALQRQDITDEMRSADFWRGARGRDEVLARHVQRISHNVSQALRKRPGESAALEEALAMLSDQLASQALLIQALLCYLEDSSDFDKAKFREIMLNLDAADGEVDGKLGGRKAASRRPNRP